MKILSCCPYGYYSGTASASYEYLSFVEVPRSMGHTVHHFEFRLMARADREAMNEFFLSVVKHGGYDLVLVTLCDDEFIPEVLAEAKRYTATLAWNCDDEFRWDAYSSHWAPHFTFMATTHRPVYEANRTSNPGLLLSQWACTGLVDYTDNQLREYAFSFVGRAFGSRLLHLRALHNTVGIEAFGRGVKKPLPLVSRLRNSLAARIGVDVHLEERELKGQDEVYRVWGHSKVAFTPLEGVREDILQIKARVFDMGLSGCVMLCNRNAAIDEYYTRDEDYMDYVSIEECAEKARYLLSHESERHRMAQRYAAVTRARHLWSHRFEALFKQMGFNFNG